MRLFSIRFPFLILPFFLVFSSFNKADAFQNDPQEPKDARSQSRKRAKIGNSSQPVDETIELVRKNTLGNLSLLPDEIIEKIFDRFITNNIFDFLIQNHSFLAQVSRGFRDFTYNANYWKEICSANQLNFQNAQGNSPFIYFKENLAQIKGACWNTPKTWIRFVPFLERFPFTKEDAVRNDIPFRLYQKIEREGSEPLQMLARLHMARMRVEELTDRISMKEALQIINSTPAKLVSLRAKNLMKEALQLATSIANGLNSPPMEDSMEEAPQITTSTSNELDSLPMQDSMEEALQITTSTSDELDSLSKEDYKHQRHLLHYTGIQLYDKDLEREGPFDYLGFGDEFLGEKHIRIMEDDQFPVRIRNNSRYLFAKRLVENLDNLWECGEWDQQKTFMRKEHKNPFTRPTEVVDILSTTPLTPKEAGYARYLAAKLIIIEDLDSNSLTDEEAYQIFTTTAMNEELPECVRYPQEIRAEAACLRAIMRVDRRTSNITDADAFNILQSVIDSKTKISVWAKFYQALLGVYSRIPHEILSDEKTFQLLTEVAEDEDFPESTINDAKYFQAKMRYHKRTAAITDAQAYEILQQVTRDEDSVESITMEADTLRLIMMAEDRVGNMNTNNKQIVFMVLSDRLSQAHLYHLTRAHKRLIEDFLKKMQENGCVPPDSAIF